jgi:IMP dehydrogenase/GMP reductase
MIFERNLQTFKELNLSVKDVLLVPDCGILKSRSEASLLPYMFSAPMDTVTGYDLAKVMIEHNQLPVLSRFLDESERIKAFFAFSNYKNNFWWAVSSDFDYEKNFLEQLRAHIDPNEKINICIDVAHGDTDYMHEVYSKWRKLSYVKDIMSGSIATSTAALRCIDSGCNYLRVGIGPGAACTTRLVTGVGVPQLSAIFDIYNSVNKAGLLDEIMIIADGGITSSGDAVKYFAAGATHIMLGKLLSYSEESAGWDMPDLITAIKLRSRNKVKKYRGQASKDFQLSQYGVAKNVEGESSQYFNPKYTYKELLEKFNDGLQSAISYLGIQDLSDINPKNVEFRKITMNGWQESNVNLS